jgi:hypothetical protein
MSGAASSCRSRAGDSSPGKDQHKNYRLAGPAPFRNDRPVTHRDRGGLFNSGHRAPRFGVEAGRWSPGPGLSRKHPCLGVRIQRLTVGLI